MKRAICAALLVTSVACGSHQETAQPSNQLASTGTALLSDCVATVPGDCVYDSAATHPAARLPGLIAVSSAHRAATIPLRVHYPAGASGVLPVVVWSHGGGLTAGENDKGQYWAQTLAAAGYAVVKISHLDRRAAEAAALCPGWVLNPDGTPAMIADCSAFDDDRNKYDKAMDVRAVLDSLAEVEAAAHDMTAASEHPLDFDLDRVVVAGHSGGAAATMSVAGAPRQVGGHVFDFTHPLPLAFVMLSPTGPGGGGFGDTFDGMVRPAFTATGIGDSKAEVGKSWSERASLHDLMPADGLKIRFFIDSHLASHGLFNLGRDSHAPYQPWLQGSVVAFLDAIVRGDSTARNYLRGGDVVGELALDADNIPSGEAGAPVAWTWKLHGLEASVSL